VFKPATDVAEKLSIIGSGPASSSSSSSSTVERGTHHRSIHKGITLEATAIAVPTADGRKGEREQERERERKVNRESFPMMGRHKRQQQPFDEGTISPINKFFPIARKIFSDLKVPSYVNINYLDKNRIDKTIDAWLHDSGIFVISAIIGYDHIGWRDGNSNIIETWQGTRLTLKKNTFDDLTTRKSLSDLYRNFFQTDTRRVALGPIKDAIKAVKDDFEKLSPEIQELFHIVFEKTDVAMLMKTFDGTLSNFMCLYSKHKLEIDPILQSKHIKFIVRLPDITGSTNINVVCGRPNGTKNHISKARNTQTTLSNL